jgi:endonuclease/exonuclease/phosphatase family metal-dependent hydrolase
VALLQEAVVPVTWRGHAVFRAGGISETRPWGSAIVSRSPLEPLETVITRYSTSPAPVDHSHPGAVTVAVIHPPKGEPITVVSVYGLIEYGYAVTTLHRILSDLTPLFDSPHGRRVVIGGDLNCSTQLAPPHRARHRTVFDRFASLGLVNVSERRLDAAVLDECPCADEPCRHVRTHFHSRSQKPWQDDYVFVSKPLASKVCCEVLDRGATGRPLSDHAPVMVSITS